MDDDQQRKADRCAEVVLEMMDALQLEPLTAWTALCTLQAGLLPVVVPQHRAWPQFLAAHDQVVLRHAEATRIDNNRRAD